jgi:hypothetical protein
VCVCPRARANIDSQNEQGVHYLASLGYIYYVCMLVCVCERESVCVSVWACVCIHYTYNIPGPGAPRTGPCGGP